MTARAKDTTRASARAIGIMVTAWCAFLLGIVGVAGWGLWQVAKVILHGVGWSGA
jgi:hypothetical protein